MQTFDIVVIGAGVAGLGAATLAAQGGFTVAVIESAVAGGQISNVDAIDNFPGQPKGTAGYELGPLLQEQASDAGAEFVMATVSSISAGHEGQVATAAAPWSVHLDDGGALLGRCVIIAAGSSKRRLGVPGEDALRGRGVSQCASCDGPLFRGSRVVVVGGGDSALQEALELQAHVAHITLVQNLAALTAQPSLIARATSATTSRAASSGHIDMLFSSEVEAIEGDSTVTGVVVRSSSGEGRRTIACDGVFVYVGLEPDSAFVRGLVRLDDTGHIVVDEGLQTSLPGIYAAGDIRSGSAAMLASSAGDGATAAMSAMRRLGVLRQA